MAERLIINIEGNAADFNKAIDSAERRLNNLNTRISNTSRNLTNFQTRLNNLSQSFNAMTTANIRAAQSVTTMVNRLNAAASASNRATNNFRQTTRQTNALETSLKKIIITLASVQTVFFATKLIFGPLLGSIIEINSNYERQTVLLTNLSKASTEAGKAMEVKKDRQYLWDLAANAPFKLDALAESFTRFKANGLDPTNGSLQTLVDSIAAFGGTTENLKMASLAIQQMASKGTVSMEELRQQLADSGGIPDALKSMAEGLGFDIQNLKKFYKAVKDGKVDAQEGLAAMFRVLEKKHHGAALAMMNTWSGLMSRMSTAWQKFVIRVTDSSQTGSFFQTMKNKVMELTTFLNSKEGDEFAKQLSETFAKIVIALGDLVAWFYRYRNIIIATGKVLLEFWAISKGWSILRSITLGIVGLVTQAIYLTRVLGLLMTVTRASQVVLLLFGQAAVTTARSLGILTVAGNLTRVGLVSLLRTLGLFAAPITIVLALLQIASTRYHRANDAGASFHRMLSSSNDRYKKAEDLTYKLATATGKLADETRALTIAEIQKQRVFGAKLIGDVRSKYDEDKAAHAELAAIDNNPNYTARDKNYLRKPASEKVTKLDKELELSSRALEVNTSSINLMKNALADDYVRSHPETPEGADSSGGGSGKAGKADPTESLRNRLVNLRTEIARTAAEAKGLGDEFDSESFDEAIRSSLDFAATEEQLKDAILNAKDELKNQKQQMRDDTAFKDLTATIADQTEQTKQARGAFDQAYNSIDSQVERYDIKLRKQYDAQLKSKEEHDRFTKSILDADEEFRQELIANQVISFKEMDDSIRESLMSEDELREYNYQKELKRIDNLLQLKNLSDSDRIILSNARANLVDNNLRKKDPLTDLRNWAKSIKDFDHSVGEAASGWLDGFVDQLANGKFAFKDFAKSIISDLAKIIIRAYIAKFLLSALGSGFTMSQPSAAGLPTAASLLTQPNFAAMPLVTPTMHQGGIVGIFGGAKRFHRGGFPGLRSDEVPIIAQKGEGVFTREQMQALGNNKNKMQQPQINIVNQTSTPINHGDIQTRFDPERMVIDIVMKNASKPGPMRDMLKGMK